MNKKYALLAILVLVAVVVILLVSNQGGTQSSVRNNASSTQESAIEQAQEATSSDSDIPNGQVTEPTLSEPDDPADAAPTPPSSSSNSDDSVDDSGAETSYARSCEEAGGNWLPEYSECEYIRPEWCQRVGGTYNSCASACRHDPDAQVCTYQCVGVCSLR